MSQPRKILTYNTVKDWRFWVLIVPTVTIIILVAFVLFLIAFLGEMLTRFGVGGMNGIMKYVIKPLAKIVQKNKQDES